MNLWFENRYGEERLIASVKTWDDVFHCINEFIRQCNEHKPKDKQFKSYYIRTWQSGDRVQLDVGSHNEFFYTDLPYEEFKNNSKGRGKDTDSTHE